MSMIPGANATDAKVSAMIPDIKLLPSGGGGYASLYTPAERSSTPAIWTVALKRGMTETRQILPLLR